MRLALGIDLAGQNVSTAACAVEWHEGRAVARAPVVGARGEEVDWLVELAREAAWVGIDAPFGWPDAFVQATSAWSLGERWPDAAKVDLRFRLTDRLVRERTGRWPLSVSSDWIAVVALRCARLLDGLRSGDRAIDRAGADGVFEVYPGAALTCWGLQRAGYKTRGDARSQTAQREARAALVAELDRRTPGLDLAAAHDACVASDDALDALLAALVARCAGTGRTLAPPPGAADRIAREGWIHLPAAEALGQLV